MGTITGLSHMTNEGEGWYHDYGGPLSAGFSVEAAMEEFIVCFAAVVDPRQDNARHDLHDLLLIALCNMLTGGKDCSDMARFGGTKAPFLRSRHGIASHDTLSRVFRRLGQSAVDGKSNEITTLPEQLRQSLTWDQGAEMSQYAQLRIDRGLPIYFCDLRSPWQRGTNENTNGLLRQYFPKGTDLSAHSADDLAAVGAALNTRPRKTLGWRTPAEAFDQALRSVQAGVATTG